MAIAELEAPLLYDDRYEVIDGHVTEMPEMSAESNGIGNFLAARINAFAEEKFGMAFVDMLIELKLPKHRNRRPDVLFVPYSVWPMGKRLPRSNAWAVTPTICVEVVSPTDSAEEVMTKVIEYLEAGVAEVWVIYPVSGVAMTFNSTGQTRLVRNSESLTGGAALPGFSLKLAQLLPEAE